MGYPFNLAYAEAWGNLELAEHNAGCALPSMFMPYRLRYAYLAAESMEDGTDLLVEIYKLEHCNQMIEALSYLDDRLEGDALIAAIRRYASGEMAPVDGEGAKGVSEPIRAMMRILGPLR